MSDIKFASKRTIAFLINSTTIALAPTKRGQGEGYYNGYGGGVKSGEDYEDAAVRETLEEGDTLIEKCDLEEVATLEFIFPNKPEWNQKNKAYFIRKWKGEPKETEEMGKPEWFNFNSVPYDKMWESDRIWLRFLLSGEKVKMRFFWKNDNKTVDRYEFID